MRSWALLTAVGVSVLAMTGCPDGGGAKLDGSADGSAGGSAGGDETAEATGTMTAPGSATDSDGGGSTDAGPTDGSATMGTTGPGTGGETADAGETEATDGDDTTGGTTGGETSESDSDSESESDSESSSGGEPLSDDPFDPSACEGAAWSGADALAYLGGLDREVLDGATIQIRTRECPGGACGPWSANEDWEITYLTYSGGVVTRWMDLLASMNLVLFDDGGTAQLSMQHTTFAAGGYPDDDGMVYDFPPTPITYPHIRAFNEFPRYDSDYIDLDYQVTDGTLVIGEDCAAWTAEPFGKPEPHTEQYGALFRW